MTTRYLHRFNLRQLAPVFILAGLLAMASGCNSDDPENESNMATLSTSTAVTAFSLKANSKVMKNLDSVYFSIDLNRGVIFNADSLPMGTNVSKLVPKITYASGCTAAVITMKGGSVREGETDYLKTPGDSIDFTGNVTLTLQAQDGSSSRTYVLKVNVHKMQPDSLTFNEEAVYELQSRNSHPKQQRTVEHNGLVTSLIQENDGTFTLATSDEPEIWTSRQISLPFAPQLRSMTSAGGKLYMLDTAGKLYTSADGNSWTDAGKTWAAIIGAYGDDLLGLLSQDGKYYHTSLSGAYPDKEIESGFPVKGLGNLICLSNKWSAYPTALLTGGVDASGNPVAGTWGFDGQNWVKLSSDGIPALEAPAVVPYFIYKKTSAMWLQSEFSVLMAFGGRKADGTMNADTYISMNNGISWTKATSNLSLPEIITPSMGADALILSTKMKGDLQNALLQKSKIKRRLSYNIEGYDISWDCPYIYIFGGTDESGALNDLIWRGVLARLTFMPLI